MIDEAQIEELLKEFWTDETEVAGRSNVRAISRGVTEFKPAAGGANIDILPVLTTLVAAATLIKTILDIVKILKERQSKPTVSKIKEFLEKEGIYSTVIINIDDAKLEQLILKLSSEHESNQ